MMPASVVPAQPGPPERVSAGLASAGLPSAGLPGVLVHPADPGRLRVLLVEDDDADAYLVRELLDEANATIDLSVATSLAEAAGQLNGIDCVLLDLGLPDAQGLDGLRRLLSLAHGAAVCVLTGIGDEHLGAAAVAEGAQDYLIKGQVDGVLLARSVRYAVERRRADENARRLHEVELLQQESARLERGLLPQPLLHTDAVRLHTFYQPGRQRAELGGDFYDVVQTAPERLALMVGDVSGRGVDEAALGVELRVAWRALVLAGVADDAILSAIEQVLISERKADDIFATLAMVSVDLAGQVAEVRLAGHPPPLLLTPGAAAAVPATFGSVLGVFDNGERPPTRIDLGPGNWSMLLFTDGLIEGRAGDGTHRLGIAGLTALITSPQGQLVPTGELPGWLVGQAEEANGGPLADDVAMLMLGRGDP
jgi:serine phosphatase RsbU (regulator of sigma subunit)